MTSWGPRRLHGAVAILNQGCYQSSMDPRDRQREFSRVISEGLNCMGVFLCGPAFEKLGPHLPDLLRQWETECGPKLDRIGNYSSGQLPALRPAVARVSAIVSAGVDFKSWENASELREAIRGVMVALGFTIPVVPPTEASICELHGSECPVLLRQL